jgi:hypothetical protein
MAHGKEEAPEEGGRERRESFGVRGGSGEWGLRGVKRIETGKVGEE